MQAAARLAAHGANALSKAPQTPALVRFLRKFLDKFMLMLLLAGVLCHVAFAAGPSTPPLQGLTLVHFSAQRKLFWREGAFRG